MKVHDPIAVVGLGYGDEGKGTTVDYLCAGTPAYDSTTVVRFNGGPQAGHNVVQPDGTHHCFSQWGSGTMHGARTYLSRFVSIDPYAMDNEAAHLKSIGIPSPYELLTIDGACQIVTLMDRQLQRHRDAQAGPERNGCCGTGYGISVERALMYPGHELYMHELSSPSFVLKKLTAIRDLYFDLDNPVPDEFFGWDLEEMASFYHEFWRRTWYTDHIDRDWPNTLFRSGERVIFEGAQGVMLDEDYGFHPYTTWSHCTLRNVHKLLEDCVDVELKKLGVLRTFSTRHGPGPFVSEATSDHDIPWAVLKGEHNDTNPWQGDFRVGHFDAVAGRHALSVIGDDLDGLVVTHCDKLDDLPEVIVDAYCSSAGHGRFWRPDALDPSQLDWREQYTAELMECEPYIVGCALPHDARAHEIAGRIGMDPPPVLIESHGPTWRDKRVVRGKL